MIVKIQKPLSDPNAMWLVYAENKAAMVLLHKGQVPEAVRDVVEKGAGKAYFEANVNGKQVTFGAPAADQKW